jgi:glycosyltransferase involved in cell wall biosynthesis
MPSVVVPAHNEAPVLGRLLHLLTDGATTPPLDVIVVCNGCTDDTEEVARRFPSIRVVATAEAGKANALRLGDSIATTFPRIYVDADVEVDRAGIYALCRALESPSVLASAPERRIALEKSSAVVRSYYEFWQALPRVREGLFGRGVIAVSEAGFSRLTSHPELMADDLAASAAFAPHERRIVSDAYVVVHPPRTWGALIRRRVRAATGTRQYYEAAELAPRVDSRTTATDLIGVVRSGPTQLMRLPVFLAATVLARRGAAKAARSGDFTTWLRDDSRELP